MVINVRPDAGRVKAYILQKRTFQLSAMLRDVKNRDHPWSLPCREFLRAVRGKRSQRAFSRRLGYQSKPLADWESGRRFPDAATALRACRIAGIDVKGALARFFPNLEPSAGELGPDEIASWLRGLRGNTAIVELAARAGEPRFSVSRWLSGQSRPRLPQFFGLVEAITGRASDLIAELVDIRLVPSVAEQHAKRRVSRSLAHDEPWTAAVLRVLETVAYAELDTHVPGWIARYLGIDLEVEARCVEALERAGMIAFRDGRYWSSPATVDTQVTPDENRRIKRHWSLAASERIADADDADLFAYNVVAVSHRDLDRIRQIMRSAFREIRSLVSVSKPSEEVALVQLQLVEFRPPATDCGRRPPADAE